MKRRRRVAGGDNASKGVVIGKMRPRLRLYVVVRVSSEVNDLKRLLDDWRCHRVFSSSDALV